MRVFPLPPLVPDEEEDEEVSEDEVEPPDYPLPNAKMVLYADGVRVPLESVETNARSFTAKSPPPPGSVMTADYEYVTEPFADWRLDRIYRGFRVVRVAQR